MLRLLRKDNKGVESMKRKWLLLTNVCITIIALACYGPTALAEESGSLKESVRTTETSLSNTASESSGTEVTLDNSSKNSTEADAETTAADALSFVEDKIGVVTTESLSQVDFSSGESIREGVLSDDYGITKSELDLLTNEQLVNAMTLFSRYNEDINGMDIGAYVRTLKALYVDRTISWDKVSKELSFVPNSFSNFTDMISHVDELQAYLQALYPKNSSFIVADPMTNDELIAVLKHLNEIGDGPFGGGRILNIISRIDKGLPQDSATSTSTSSTEKKTVATTSSTQADAKKKDGNLPKTGEEKAKRAVTIAGIVIVLSVIILLIVRRNKKRNNT